MTDGELCDYFDCDLECESPLEIRSKDGRSLATGEFAWMLLYQMKQRYTVAKRRRDERKEKA